MVTQQQKLPTIDGFFDFRSHKRGEPFSMYVWDDKQSKERLYIVNQHKRKLLQLIVKAESVRNNRPDYAQIKLIPYGINRACVYRDQLSDPKIVRLYDAVELTYHGGPKGDQNPKIHLKGSTTSNRRYQTLIDYSLVLNKDAQILIPVFSLFPGYLYDKPVTDTIKRKSHIFRVDSTHPIRFDIYLCGKQFNIHLYINSMYSFNMFYSLDYLIAKECSPLQGYPMVQPITGFDMKGYYLWVRCSRSKHRGKPFLQFYNNANYYEKVMNRRIAYINNDRSVTWKTMIDKEREISEYFSKSKKKTQS